MHIASERYKVKQERSRAEMSAIKYVSCYVYLILFWLSRFALDIYNNIVEVALLAIVKQLNIRLLSDFIIATSVCDLSIAKRLHLVYAC